MSSTSDRKAFRKYPLQAARSVKILAWLLALVCAVGRYSGAEESPIHPDEARPHVSWQDAAQVVGRTAYVSGTVARIGHTERIHFLNFDAERRDVFTVVIFQPSLERFAPSLEELYEGRPVRVRGIVTTYAGTPQIQVTSPDQIEVLDSLPVLPKPAKPPQAKVGEEFTLATFNVRNLFDADDDPYHNDEGTPAKPRMELERLAAAIRLLDADVLALQEVENRGYLERFLEVFLPDARYQHVVHFEGNDRRGIDVCLLTRMPVGAVTSYRHATFADDEGQQQHFQRDLLCVQIEPPGAPAFEVWVVHLKSNSEGRKHAEPIRLTEAKAVRRLLDQRLRVDPNAAIFVCGDFNDTPDSPTVKTISGTGAMALASAWSNIPDSERITYNLEPYRSMIDFILWTPALDSRYVKDSYGVIPGSLEEVGSDHNPVRVRFHVH